jgi:hypothetical protein
VKKFLRDNGLSLVVLGCFLLFLGGQVITGYYDHNNEKQGRAESTLTLGEYLCSGHFWEAVFENWESEFLQMAAYVLFTVFLFQRGSSESKDPDQPDGVGALQQIGGRETQRGPSREGLAGESKGTPVARGSDSPPATGPRIVSRGRKPRPLTVSSRRQAGLDSRTRIRLTPHGGDVSLRP